MYKRIAPLVFFSGISTNPWSPFPFYRNLTFSFALLCFAYGENAQEIEWFHWIKLKGNLLRFCVFGSFIFFFFSERYAVSNSHRKDELEEIVFRIKCNEIKIFVFRIFFCWLNNPGASFFEFFSARFCNNMKCSFALIDIIGIQDPQFWLPLPQ